MTASIKTITHETSDVIRVTFTLKQSLSYTAGQFLKLTLPAVVNDLRGPWRFFSIASSPTEADIMIATKASESPFKQTLANLSVGQTATVTGPFGKFVLTDDTQKTHVFLAGGIGITPIRSIVKEASDTRRPHKLLLLYSNQTPDDIVFKKDLGELVSANPNLTIVHTITRPEESKSAWTGRIGRINEELVKEYVKDLALVNFYVCGPPRMVEMLTTVVKGMGIPEENLKTERFTGYE